MGRSRGVSHPMRDVWIEITALLLMMLEKGVTSHAGCVD